MALVNDILSAIEEAKKGNVVESSSRIKRCIGMRKKGGKELLSIKTINGQLLDELLNLANENKNIESLNQALQMIAIDEDDINKQKRIYKQILGYKGTSINDLSPEYIDEIIRGKIDLENGINKEDIIGILKLVITKAETDYNIDNEDKEKYIKLVNDTIIPVVDQDISSNEKKVTDTRILEILTDLGRLYAPNYEKAYEILGKGEKLKQFESTDIYNENNKELKKAELLKDFNGIECNEKDLKQKIKEYLGLFMEGIQPKNPNPKHKKPDPIPKPRKQAQIMDIDKKIDAILYLLNELKKDFPNARINGIFAGKRDKENAFRNNVLIPIENVGITILETLSGSGALYITQNSNITEFLELKVKSDAREMDNVKTVSHTNKKTQKMDEESRYENYKKTLVKRAQEVIDGIRNNGTIGNEQEIKVYSQSKITNTILENEQFVEDEVLEDDVKEPITDSENEELNNDDHTHDNDEDDLDENELNESGPDSNNPNGNGLGGGNVAVNNVEELDEEDPLANLSMEELENMETELDNSIEQNNNEIIDLDSQIDDAKLQEKKLIEEAKKEEIRRRIREKQRITQEQKKEKMRKKAELHDLKENNNKLKKNKNIGNQD